MVIWKNSGTNPVSVSALVLEEFFLFIRCQCDAWCDGDIIRLHCVREDERRFFFVHPICFTDRSAKRHMHEKKKKERE